MVFDAASEKPIETGDDIKQEQQEMDEGTLLSGTNKNENSTEEDRTRYNLNDLLVRTTVLHFAF